MQSTLRKTDSKNIRILGIDPGTATTGWAIIEEKNCKLKAVAYGSINTHKSKTESHRLYEIHNDLSAIIKKFQPKEAAIEKIFFFKNQKTVIPVSQARGAILLTLEQKRVKIFGYTPLQVKQSLTGYGRAEKKQIQLMAKNILELKTIPRPDDTADAIAVAVCHLNSRSMQSKCE